MKLKSLFLACAMASLLLPCAGQAKSVLLPDDTPSDNASSSAETATSSSATTTGGGTIAPTEAAPTIMPQLDNSDGGDPSMTLKQALDSWAAHKKQLDDQLKPTFIEDRPNMPPPDIIMGNLKQTMSVHAADRYIWGVGDVAKISRILNYAPKEISANCQLRLETRIVSDIDRSYRLSILAGQQVSFNYQGNPQSLEFTPRALCIPPKTTLPNSGEILRKASDGRYVIQLDSTASCKLGSAMPASVDVKYTGDGTVVCK